MMRSADLNVGSSQYVSDLRVRSKLDGLVDKPRISIGKFSAMTVDVLNSAATHRDVEQLGASADAQYRCIFCDSALPRVQTELISVLVNRFLLFSKVNLIIKARVNITSTK